MKPLPKFISCLILGCILSVTSISLAQTTLNVRFIESAPKDSFVIQNQSECNLNDFTLTIDLQDSIGKLIFDTTESGAGVEVFQPFEIVSGDIELVTKTDDTETDDTQTNATETNVTETNNVNDGDTALTLRINQLASMERAAFTIDLDDTLVNSELGMIRVTGSEIENATVGIMTQDDLQLSANFDSNSTANIALESCF